MIHGKVETFFFFKAQAQNVYRSPCHHHANLYLFEWWTLQLFLWSICLRQWPYSLSLWTAVRFWWSPNLRCEPLPKQLPRPQITSSPTTRSNTSHSMCSATSYRRRPSLRPSSQDQSPGASVWSGSKVLNILNQKIFFYFFCSGWYVFWSQGSHMSEVLKNTEFFGVLQTSVIW